MKECTALELIRCKMKEMEVSDYIIRYRHFKLFEAETRTIKAKNDLFFLIDPTDQVRVQSRSGIFDLIEKSSRELQYIHSDEIEITSLDADNIVSVIFIQVIPNQNC